MQYIKKVHKKPNNILSVLRRIIFMINTLFISCFFSQRQPTETSPHMSSLKHAAHTCYSVPCEARGMWRRSVLFLCKSGQTVWGHVDQLRANQPKPQESSPAGGGLPSPGPTSQGAPIHIFNPSAHLLSQARRAVCHFGLANRPSLILDRDGLLSGSYASN